MVQRQFQGSYASKLLDPVAAQPLELLALQPLTLPGGEVGVLDRQLRQRRRLTAGIGQIEERQLPLKHGHRPTVVDHVVRADHRHMVVFRQAEQRDADRGPFCRSIGRAIS